jgi:hypothetical protein
MAITAHWESTETNTQGERTEVVLPLHGLDETHPAEDKLLGQVLREALPETDGPPLWEKLKLDRETCRLHMFVDVTADVTQIKTVLDEALLRASQAIADNTAARERHEAEAKTRAEFRRRQALSLRDAFRSS